MKIKRYRFRLIILLVLMISGMYFLLTRLQRLQIEEQGRWEANVPSEKEETVRIPPTRGNILDRNGVILATNKVNYELDLNLEKVRQFYRESWSPKLELETLGRREGGMVAKKNETDIYAIANTTILQQLKQFGFEERVSPRAMRIHYKTHKGLIGFNYSDSLSFEEFCLVSEHSSSLPGAEVSVRPRRIYSFDSLAGHVLGKTKQWAKGDIPDHERSVYDHYTGDMYGDSGVEQTMNEYLRGVPGKRTISKGPKGVFLGIKEEIPPSSGANVYLTIDAGLQSYVERLMRNVGRGGISVVNVKTGEVLALATVPTINPNDYIPSISKAQYAYYDTNIAAPFLNNALEEHQPGSVFKLPVALAAAQANFMGFKHKCIGYEEYGLTNKKKIHCHKTYGHGTLDMATAIQKSCNPYFMALANHLGGKHVVDTYTLLGFGEKTGVQVGREEPGIVPGSLKWKRYHSQGESFNKTTLAYLSIGQAMSSASTLQVACATAAIANNGQYMRPRIVKSVKHPESGIIIDDQPIVKVDLLNEGISANSIDIVKRGMWKAVNETGGTASRVKFSDTIEAAAKTGTAQTQEFGKKSNNAWTTAFAPYDDPQYAVCVVVIGGKSGGKVAGPIVRETFKALFAESIPTPQIMPNYKGNVNEIEELELVSEFEEEADETNE